NLGARSEGDSVHIVLEHMPCNLDAALSYSATKENIREILRQILSGVAHIHSKSLAHRDIRPRNILLDPETLSVKICDLGNCCDGERREFFLGVSVDGYRRDISSVACIMAHLYLGGYFSRRLYTDLFIIHRVELFLKAKERGGVLPDSRVGMVCKAMEEVVSKNGMDLFLQLIASRKTGGYTAAAEVLEHPFFAEGREQDLPFGQRWLLKCKQQLCFR
ncbi:MAG: uncharacterized protein A8A55_3403, partial [Amphiamblys sp. WSBS2006]